MVHDSNARTKSLDRFIVARVVNNRRAFEISRPKQDGTVVVRFRSLGPWDAVYLASTFGRQLDSVSMKFTQTDDNKIRLALDQFSASSLMNEV